MTLRTCSPRLASTGLSFLLLWCSLSLASDEVSPLQQVDGAPDLERIKNGKFAETYVNSEADFTRYNSLYLGDALWHYREVSGSKMTAGIYSNTQSRNVFEIAEVLARVAERGVIGNSTGVIDVSRKANRATVIGDVKRWARGAARRLRTALDAAITG